MLIFKLKQNGIPVELLQILPDFSSNSKQRVVFHAQNLSLTNVHPGVLQGSILGPLLFLIYINHLSDMTDLRAKTFAHNFRSWWIGSRCKHLRKRLVFPKQACPGRYFELKIRKTHPPTFSFQQPLVFNNNNVSQTCSLKHFVCLFQINIWRSHTSIMF